MGSYGSSTAEKKVLTQEMFEEEMETNECIDPGQFLFESYIVDGIKIDDSLETGGKHIIFIGCDVINLDVHIVNGCRSEVEVNEHGERYQTGIEFEDCYIDSIKTNKTLYFYGCTIKNYRNVELFAHHYYNFKTNNPCTFEIEPPMACPKEGGFIGYKKCITKRVFGPGIDWCIVKLLIPADAKRSSSIFDEENPYQVKCRCSKVKVLGIHRLNGTRYLFKRKAYSFYTKPKNSLVYKIGEWVYPDSFDDNRYDECSHGIHFFMTLKEATEF